MTDNGPQGWFHTLNDKAKMVRVSPVIDPSVRDLCLTPYDLHPRGCPNFGKRATCPPQARRFSDVYDMARPVWAVVNEFNLARHVAWMRTKHPDWSDRQLRCVLYWQPRARASLRLSIAEAIGYFPDGYTWETCAEAMGVNLTATLAVAGITLEWPPVRIARQVALIAYQNATQRGSKETP